MTGKRILLLFAYFLITLSFVRTNYASQQPFMELHGNWQYRFGNSPVDSSGQYTWLKSSFNDTSWKSTEYISNIATKSEYNDIWYRIVLPENNYEDPAVYIRFIKGIAEVFVDDKIIYSSGDFSGKTKVGITGWNWHLFKLPNDYSGKTLIIHIRAGHKYPGILGDILLGNSNVLLNKIVRNNLFVAVLGVLFILSGLLFWLFLFLMKELSKFKGFVILQISMGIWTLTPSPVLQFLINAPVVFYYLNHISMFVAAIGFFMLTENVLAARYKIFFRRVWQFLSVYSVIMIIIDVIFQPFHLKIALPFYTLIAFFILCEMYYSAKSYKIVKHSTRVFIIGLNSYVFFALVEILRYFISVIFSLKNADTNILHAGGFCSFVFLSWIIISRYVEINNQIITTQENERKRIARDLHDEIGPRLTEIRMVSELIKRPDAAGEMDAQKLNELSIAADSVISAFSEIVWALNPGNNTLEELGTYLGQYSSDFLQKAGIRCRLILPPAFPEMKIAYDTRRDIILAVKESLNNIVKHAAATIVTITISSISQNLVIKISDDGKGFDITKTRKYGNGLKNIHHRIEGTGGTVNLNSELNGGTITIMTIPLQEFSQL